MQETLIKVLNSNFQELLENGIKIKCFFVTEMMKSKDKLVMAKISTANDRVKILTAEEINEGYDYIIDVDKHAWEYADEDVRKKMLRHELRHVKIYPSKDGTIKCGLRGHDFEDFEIEIELNKDDPNWASKLALIVESQYDMEKESKKAIR